MLHKNIILVVNSHIYAFTHLHLMTVKSMSQINHYQDESDYALKRIDGKMLDYITQINIPSLFLIICIMVFYLA